MVRSGSGIVTPGTGGACLIADLNVIGLPGVRGGVCSSDKQCTDALQRQRAGGSPYAEWFSYCVSGRCWTRPGGRAQYCRISGTELPLGRHLVSGPLYGGRSLNWRVHTCLNGRWNPATPGQDKPPCAQRPYDPAVHGQRQRRDGTPRTL
ncbi:MAG: hypothetical protein H0T82_00430 [Sphingomonas sp.]|nr:hypothetical protein [Sphingomonas sp.]